MKKFFKEYSVYIAWGISLVALVGSLYYSEVMNLPPCVLCWYQRICIYPLVIILGVGIWFKNRQIYLYALPLSIIAFLVGVYHNLLYYNILPESAAPCVAGISCTARLVELFGFLTIPAQALIASTLITLLLIIYWRTNRDV
jgi:disulfide bond formation protein DsbB